MRKILSCIGFVGFVAFLVSVYTPVWNTLASRLAVAPTEKGADAIVVLGSGATVDGKLSDESMRRLIRGIQLYKRGFGPVLVVSGPKPRHGTAQSEAQARRSMALEMEVPATSIITVEDVQTTRDEAAQIALIMTERHAKSIVLVTESLHMRRAMRLFENSGLIVAAAPTDDVASSAQSPNERINLLYSVLQQGGAILYYRIARYL
jgi:uncharacterized SAM-binding protein YcdF (DUF218 family)